MVEKNGLSFRVFTMVNLDDFYEWESDEKVTEFVTWDMFSSKEKVKYFVVKVVIPHPLFKEISLNGKSIRHVRLKPRVGIHNCRVKIGYTIA
eukprot:Gb_34735 [translate_table: standard]